MTALLVAFGGGLGAVLRYWIGTTVQGMVPGPAFPWGTLVVNVTGCFAMGVVAAASDRHSLSAEWRAFLAVGVLGGFTTFSAFANETIGAARAGVAPVAVMNVVASVALCLLAVSAGRLAGGWWLR